MLWLVEQIETGSAFVWVVIPQVFWDTPGYFSFARGFGILNDPVRIPDLVWGVVPGDGRPFGIGEPQLACFCPS